MNRSNDFATSSRCSSGKHPARVSRCSFTRAIYISPPCNSSSLSSRARPAKRPLGGDISPFFVLKHCSSGSITKSIHFPDFWSPFNEEPLDENRLFWVKRLFLFAHPTGRVCAEPRRLHAAIGHAADKSQRRCGRSSAHTPHTCTALRLVQYRCR